MTIKILSAVAIVISCSFVGMRMANSLRLRVRMLTDMLAAVGQIESCIAAVRMPLTEIYDKLSKSKGIAGEFFSKVTPGISWKSQMGILSGLSVRDKAILIDLSEKLGAYETEREIDELKLTQNFLREELDKARTEMLENSKIYRSMSFFTGVVIAILLM